MPLVSKTVPGLFNGVSQQPAGVRLETQCEEQINCFPTLADGLMKRQPAEYIGQLNVSAIVGKPYVRPIRRDETEKYIVILTGNATNPIDVFKLDGTKMTIRYGRWTPTSYTADNTVKSYLTVTNPRENIKALTIADYTIIVNTTEVCAMKSDVVAGSIAGTVQSFDKLPTSPTTGQIYRISGDRFDDFTGYYVKFDGTVYEECAKPGEQYKINPDTMPHALVRTGTNEMTFTPLVYNDRYVSDLDTSPLPSFIGTTVGEVFMFKNRLGFLTDENYVLSRSGDLFNFFRKTALELLDDDPIDAGVSTEEVALLRHAVAFNESLLLFSEPLQFSINAEKNLTPKTAGADITTRFPADPKCAPVGAGANVYFASPLKEHMSIREYFVQPDSLVNDAANVTAHVPRYLPPSIHTIVSMTSLDTLILLSDDTPNTLYVYKYYWQGNEKVQSAWGKWTFTGSVVSACHMDASLYVIIKQGNEYWLEAITLEDTTTGSLNFRVHLDHQVELTGVFDGFTTTWTLPYTMHIDIPMAVVHSVTGLGIPTPTRTSDTTVVAVGNYADAPCYLGVDYAMLYRFSEWAIRDQKANVASLEGRLQVRNIMLSYVDTGYLRLEVTPKGRDPLITEYVPRVIGGVTLGTPPIETGKRKFPVLANAVGTTVDVVNDTYLPTRLQNASWEGLFHQRSKGI